MTHVEELTSQIIEQPADDDVRLVFADAIQDDDPEWARHIRYALRPDIRFAEPLESLRARLSHPFQKYGKVSCGFERGFISRVSMHPETFLAHGAEILDRAPILQVTFTLTYDDRTPWNVLLPGLMQSPALARVRHLRFWMGTDFDYVSMQHIIRSPYLEKLIKLTTPGNDGVYGERADEEAMWELLFASSTFRGMIDWGLRLAPHALQPSSENPVHTTFRQVGDRILQDRPGSLDWLVTSYEPMPPEDRALEQRYGYIPRLHATNWDATVLDVLRGTKPDFPVGAPPVEPMYAVPATTRHKDGNADDPHG